MEAPWGFPLGWLAFGAFQFSSWASGIWPGAQQGLRWICQPCPPALARCVRAHGRWKVPLAGGPALCAWPGMSGGPVPLCFCCSSRRGRPACTPHPIGMILFSVQRWRWGEVGYVWAAAFLPCTGMHQGARALGSCSSPSTSLAGSVSSSGPGADVSTSVAWQWLQERTRGRAVVSQAWHGAPFSSGQAPAPGRGWAGARGRQEPRCLPL